MDETFDPYHKWFGIKPDDQPPTHYRLLGVDAFENDPTVIANAADQRMTYVRTFSAGQHARLSQRLLNEISVARLCLLDPQQKQKYDAELRGATAVASAPPARPAARSAPGARPAPMTAELVNAPPTINQSAAGHVRGGRPRSTTASTRHPSTAAAGILIWLLVIGALASVMLFVMGIFAFSWLKQDYSEPIRIDLSAEMEEELLLTPPEEGTGQAFPIPTASDETTVTLDPPRPNIPERPVIRQPKKKRRRVVVDEDDLFGPDITE